MKTVARRRAVAGVAAALLMSGNASGCTQRHSSSSRTPRPSASPDLTTDLFPAPNESLMSTADLPYRAPTTGESLPCSELPISSYYLHQFSIRDCWVIRENAIGNPDVFWLAGLDLDHPATGILIHGDVTGQKDAIGIARAPGKHGRLSIMLARKGFACVRAADGQQFKYELADGIFHQQRARSAPACM